MNTYLTIITTALVLTQIIRLIQNAIPAKVCPKCQKKASENYRPLTTKYQDGEVR